VRDPVSKKKKKKSRLNVLMGRAEEAGFIDRKVLVEWFKW
jgi:hypothetical protein